MANDDETQEPEDPSELVKHLRARLKERDDGAAAGRQAIRELAFVKAGVDTSTKLGQLFAKTFEGDLNDIEAIKAEAKEIGAFKDPAAAAETTPDTSSKPEGQSDSGNTPPPDNQSAERSNLANGGAADDGSGVDPRQDALQRSQEAIKQGATFDDAAGGYINRIAQAAAAGDQRVIVAKGRAF